MNLRSKLMAVTAALTFFTPASHADTYPTRPITLVVPFSPGGALDTVARLSAQQAAVALGQPVLVENVAGAGGTIGAKRVAGSPPDGYRLLVASTGTISVSPVVYKNLGYSPAQDLTPIAQLTSAPFLLTATNALNGSTVGDLIKQLKENPGKYNYASTGNGTLVHLAGEQFKIATGTSALHVPYSGGATAATALMTGETLFTITNVTNVLPLIQSGKLKGLATTGLTRPAGLSKYPTLAESGLPGFDATVWIGLFGPAGLPSDIVQKLNAVFMKVINDPALVARLAQQGDEPASGTSAQFAAFLAKDAAKWTNVVKTANIALD